MILTSVVVFKANTPLLVMVFEKSEIVALDSRVIASLNTLTILYNSYSVVVSVLAWIIIWRFLVNGEKWAFWTLLLTIGFIVGMDFIASAQVAHARWQVNVLLSILYVLGIGLTGFALFLKTLCNPSINITTKFWDKAAKNYDQQEAHYPHMHTKNIENARKYLQASDRVLDFGCATGIKALALAEHAREIQGIDISPKMGLPNGTPPRGKPKTCISRRRPFLIRSSSQDRLT